MALFVRFFVVIFAFFVASLAAGATLVLGAVAPEVSAPPPGDSSWPVLWFLILTTSTFVMGYAFVPAIIVVLLSESFQWRSVLVYAIAGGAIGLFCGYGFGFIEWTPARGYGPPFDSNAELMGAAGIAAGLVYWAIAGRNAGAWRNSSALEPRS